MTTAYVGVLNAINTNLGLPKYPVLPGFSGRSSEEVPSEDAATEPRQSFVGEVANEETRTIQTIFNQLRESVRNVGKLVTKVASTASDETRVTVLDQFANWNKVISKHFDEMNAIMEKQRENVRRQQQQRPQGVNLFGKDESKGLIQRFNNYVETVRRSIREFTESLLNNIRGATPVPIPVPPTP